MSFSGNIIKLNIGGTVFQTTKSTLTKFDGFFKTMMETEIPVTKDKTGAIFIDRNPKHFGKILDYMRDGDVDIPNCELECKEIYKEAQYYLLEGLMEKCKNRISSEICKIIKRLNEFGSQQEPNPLFQLSLVIHYSIEDWNVVFREISPEQFFEKYQPAFRILFKKLKRSEDIPKYRDIFRILWKKFSRINYTPKYWSHSIGIKVMIDSVLKEFSIDSEKIDVEDFLERVEKDIKVFVQEIILDSTSK